MKMSPEQKSICRELLKMSYEHGFGSGYYLAPIAEKLGITEVLYDNNTNTGILWELGPHGEGLLFISPDGESACVNMDTRGLLEHWCDFKCYGWC